MSKDTIYIIDTFSLMFQVFHAIPPMTGTQGQPTNAVFGFTRDILAILDRKPAHLVCAFDSPGEGRRNEIYSEYKANRDEMPEDLRPQIPLLKEMLAGFRIPAIEFPSWEADDVIATLATKAVEADLDVVVVSSDKDIRQLLSPRVRLFNCRKNEFLDEAKLLEDWGVRPDQVIDYQSLVGDSVDNVPGVPKVGPKTARDLIAQFGTLDEILSNADKVKGKVLQKNLVEYADLARLSRELVRLRTDLPIDLNLDETRVCEPDRPALFELFTRLGFRSYSAMMRPAASSTTSMEVSEPSPATNRLSDPSHRQGEATSTRSGGVPSATVGTHPLRSLTSLAELVEFIPRIASASTLVIDLKSAPGLIPDRSAQSLSISTDDETFVVISSALIADQSAISILWQAIAEFRGEVQTEDAKSLQHLLLNMGLQWKATFFDISIADYLLDAGARSHDLQEVVDRHGNGGPGGTAVLEVKKARQRTMFDEDEDPQSTEVQTNQRLMMLKTVSSSMKTALQQDGLTDLYNSLERPLIDVLSRMEHAGISVDSAELHRQSKSAGLKIDELTQRIYAAAQTTFNIDSPKQLSEVLFNQL